MQTADVIAFFGTQEKVAEKLGISQAAVSQWGETVPPRRAYEIQKITRGRLKVSDQKAAA